MKGNTSSGQEPISTLDWAYSLMFVSFHMKPIIRSQSYQLWDHSEWWRESWWGKEHLLSLKDTQAFLLGTLARLCPLSNREIYKYVSEQEYRKLLPRPAYVHVHIGLAFSSVSQMSPNQWKLTHPFELCIPSLSILKLWHAKSADFIFFLPWWGSVPFKGVSSPPWLSKPYCVWIVFLFRTKDRGRITISLPFTLLLSIGSSFDISNNRCLTTFASFFLPNRLG